MDTQITRSNEIWFYDPQVDGYSDGDIFKTLSGTPTISSNLLRINAAQIISLSSFRNSNLEFYLTIPTAPVAGDDKTFGFYNINDGNIGRVEFDITEAVFSAIVYDNEGTEIDTKVIDWDTDWTATATVYRISISENNIFFAIGDTIVAKFENGKDITAGTKLSKRPIAIHVANADADNVDITSITVF